MDEFCCQIFQALGDPTRVRILELLKEHGDLWVGAIAEHFDITQPSISHHLDMLKRAGLVTSEKRGQRVHYHFDDRVMVECCGKQFKLFDLVVRRK